MHRFILLLVGATVTLPALAHAAPAQPTAPEPQIQKVPEVTRIFPDVPEDHWAAAAVHRLATAGLIEGDPKGRFRGNDPLTRSEFAAVIARIIDRQVCYLGPPPGQPTSTSAPEPKVEYQSPQPPPVVQPQ